MSARWGRERWDDGRSVVSAWAAPSTSGRDSGIGVNGHRQAKGRAENLVWEEIKETGSRQASTGRLPAAADLIYNVRIFGNLSSRMLVSCAVPYNDQSIWGNVGRYLV